MKTWNGRVVVGIVLMLIAQGLIPRTVSYARGVESPETTGALALPEGRAGQQYEHQLRTEGGLAPLSWRLAGGELPAGISLDASGKLSGLPSTARRGAYSFVVEVSDSSQPAQKFSQPVLLMIQAAPLRIVSNPSPLRIVPSKGSQPVSPLAPSLVPMASKGSQPRIRVAGDRSDAGDRNVTVNEPSSNAAAPAGKKAPNISPPVLEGRTVKGFIPLDDAKTDPSTTHTPGVKVDDADVAENERSITWYKGASGYTGDFTVTLNRPLQRGQTVMLRDGDDGEFSVALRVEPQTEYDWGRVRAYFSGGVMFSKERGDFSEQDLAFRFNIEKNWFQGKHVFFNTFFEAGLTTIPVPETEPQTTTADEPAPDPSAIDEFIASKKSAALQVGAYMPLFHDSWTWRFDNAKNALFIAPIFKIGVATISNDQETQEAKSFGGDDVFNFKAGGLRFGHFKLLEDPNKAPELISYLDVVLGKYENFEVPRPVLNAAGVPQQDPAGNVLTTQEKKLRWGVEGRLKIPMTPLQIGFDANLGKGKDDVRFLFGTRFDIGVLFSKLKLLQELGVK